MSSVQRGLKNISVPIVGEPGVGSCKTQSELSGLNKESDVFVEYIRQKTFLIHGKCVRCP